MSLRRLVCPPEQLTTAVGLIIMMYPILCKVRFEELHRAFYEKSLWIQIGFSLVVNWIIAPLVMVPLCRLS